jgi:truncated hemoglobin YjbI
MDRDRSQVCRQLSEVFYARVERDPVLRPIFPAGFRCAIESLAAYLTQLLGGPCEYSERRWSLSLREAHLRFRIGPKERDAWLRNMAAALEELGIDERGELLPFFERAAAYMVNTEEPRCEEGGELWGAELAIEQAVAACRVGEGYYAIALVEGPVLVERFQRDRGALLSLLAIMSGSADAVLYEYVHRRLREEAGLTHERYTRGRTLLHEVAGYGNAGVVKLLLELGADPDARDGGERSPLHSVANACGAESGMAVVRLLVDGGADVNAPDKLKRCTPLHTAARRGYVHVARALLDCGADLEMRDSLGETPLRRAVNCGKAEVAGLLVARKADVHSVGSKGKTPLTAARSAAMRRVLEQA